MRRGNGQRIDPARRGYQVVYRPGEINHCPGCGGSNWLVGRMTAQCGFCGTALALALNAPGLGLGDDRFALAS